MFHHGSHNGYASHGNHSTYWDPSLILIHASYCETADRRISKTGSASSKTSRLLFFFFMFLSCWARVGYPVPSAGLVEAEMLGLTAQPLSPHLTSMNFCHLVLGFSLGMGFARGSRKTPWAASRSAELVPGESPYRLICTDNTATRVITVTVPNMSIHQH